MAAYPPKVGGANPPDERKEGEPMYVTYQDLVQIGMFIVALVSLIYQMLKGRKFPPLPAIVTADLV